MTLANLSDILSQQGHSESALAAADEYASITRELAAADPSTYEHALPLSLAVLSKRLSAAGRSEPALHASEEATGLYPELVGDPGGEADLERSLSQLGRVLDAPGRHEEAAAANAEANALASTHRQVLWSATTAGGLIGAEYSDR